MTPKHAVFEACFFGDLPTVKALIFQDWNIPISVMAGACFRIACSHGHLCVAKWLLNSGETESRLKKPENDLNIEFPTMQEANAYKCFRIKRWLQRIDPSFIVINTKTVQPFCSRRSLQIASFFFDKI
jgi:hypothetical protein